MLPESLQEKPRTILLVEDNSSHAALIMRSLAEHQVMNRVVHLRDGEAALDYLFQRGAYADPATSPRPHVILLDLRLPRIDGLEVLREIKASAVVGSIATVILTTSEAERDVATAYALHANSYIVKPFDFAQFTQLLHDLGLYWLWWNSAPWAST
jgi:CheY-like chemotaxis protein